MNIDIGSILDRDILDKTISQVRSRLLDEIENIYSQHNEQVRSQVSDEVIYRIRQFSNGQVHRQTATVRREISRYMAVSR